MFGYAQKTQMITPELALPGRDEAIEISGRHLVNGHSMMPPFPEDSEQLVLGLGCFWGAERRFWTQSGVIVTAAGYAGGYTKNPTYEEVCTGLTGHTEVVLVVYQPQQVSLDTLLKVFWESHDPTQGMRQGNDVGTQYRSAIYCSDTEQLENVESTRDKYDNLLINKGYDAVTTEVKLLDQFYYAEDYHQQYLARNPNGYCGLRGTGVSCEL
ncbi:peptide-methionine (S)-S-oxide reductase MsrA [Porticoccus litoralis]|jgi:peptide-methionine (S)-S-oxide reductase|uniref:Peptide methionine sulfoxide reductase MsrA n=1 Tax=Porticoccus litoralis TaxID=434086 RepID=A0AAW8B0K5_9GAMM|nr:peptide-methionine (S)-S-oxide reductase MsrA [Porticoccus litoralis]MDP1519386.1 peptide-methionine (S)-S-oxide reductase MsrA [Porticoccus litoralis]TNE84498.1 MAG: peptide-methionine (S)-S-oxide reductase MsrA [Gammaproteobacteria bacterium]